MIYKVGTRGSALALTQTATAAQLVAEAGGFDTELVKITTEGDVLTGPLSQLGGTGVFAATLRTRLLDGTVDLAVHSLKDLPTAAYPGLTVAGILPREDPRDALCARDGLTLDTLPEGARVGTGSPRRAAQLKALRPDVTIVDIRGNVGTRLARVAGLEDHGEGKSPRGDCDAVILALSGLRRLGLTSTVTDRLDPSRMLPAPGQGALAIEVRDSDCASGTVLATALASVDHLETRLAVTAERALLAGLEAGCAAPVGAYARIDESNLVLEALAANPDGSETLRARLTTDQLSPSAAHQLGLDLAGRLLQRGAARLARLSL